MWEQQVLPVHLLKSPVGISLLAASLWNTGVLISLCSLLWGFCLLSRQQEASHFHTLLTLVFLASVNSTSYHLRAWAHQLSNSSGGFSHFMGVILPTAFLWSSLPAPQLQSYLNTPVHPGTNITQSIPLSSIAFFFLIKVTPGGSLVTNLPADAGNAGSIPGSGRSPGEGNGNPLQYSCLGNPMDRGAWWATVHGVAESDVT